MKRDGNINIFTICLAIQCTLSCNEDIWMKQCNTSDECKGDRICICGSCTKFCESEDDCGSGTQCIEPVEKDTYFACIYNRTKENGTGVCLYNCHDYLDCHEYNYNLKCDERICWPNNAATTRTPGNTCKNISIWPVKEVRCGHYVPVSIAVDSKNKAHIAFWDCEAGYRYATDIEESLNTKIIFDGGVGNTAIEVDSNDFVHIIYQTNTTGGLEYKTNASDSWETEIIDKDGRVAGHHSMAVDINDNIHIVYCKNDEREGTKIVYANNMSGEWMSSVLASDQGEIYGEAPASIALDSQGNVHIADAMDAKFKYTTNASDKWVFTEINKVIPMNPSIKIGRDGIVYIISSNNTVDFITNDSGNFLYQKLLYDYPVYQASMAIDSKDNLHVCLLGSEGEVEDSYAEYLSNESGQWKSCDIGWGTGRSNSIAIGPDDSIHIAYYDGESIIYGYKK